MRNVMLIDELLRQSIQDKLACPNVPDIVFLVPCDTLGHNLSPDLSKGCFRISGKDITKLSVHQICTKAEKAGSTTGCGYDQCPTTLAKSRKRPNLPNLLRVQTLFFLLLAGFGRH